jgi:hypothetical protein
LAPAVLTILVGGFTRLAFFALMADCAWWLSLCWWHQQDPSEFRPEPLTISLGLNALRYVVDRSPGRPLSARANVPTTAVPFYLIFCALLPIVATHQEEGWLPHQPAKLRQGGIHQSGMWPFSTANPAEWRQPSL